MSSSRAARRLSAVARRSLPHRGVAGPGPFGSLDSPRLWGVSRGSLSSVPRPSGYVATEGASTQAELAAGRARRSHTTCTTAASAQSCRA